MYLYSFWVWCSVSYRIDCLCERKGCYFTHVPTYSSVSHRTWNESILCPVDRFVTAMYSKRVSRYVYNNYEKQRVSARVARYEIRSTIFHIMFRCRQMCACGLECFILANITSWICFIYLKDTKRIYSNQK